MPHGKIYHPAKFRELTGSRRPPKYDPDPILAYALQHARHKTGLGYRLWSEFVRDFPKVRDAYSGDELKKYDDGVKNIYRHLKHRDGKYMAQFAAYMKDDCEAKIRAYYKKRAHNPNERRPTYMVEKLATAVSVGAVTINDKAISVAYEPQPITPVRPKGITGMDVNKVEHVTADTDGNVKRIPNGALEAAQTRRQKHASLGVTGGKPKSKKGRSPPKHTKHVGRKPKNKKRRDERVNRRERAKINVRYGNQKQDWLFKLMHVLAASGFVLVLEEPTIDRMMKKSNKRMSNETRDLLKMGLSQGVIWTVAKSVYKKHAVMGSSRKDGW